MKQLITRIDDSLAEAIREAAADAGQSVNAYITKLLEVNVESRRPASTVRSVWRRRNSALLASRRTSEAVFG
ncbi:MAG: toxin-antitoxin system HicB family antitoxin, partial [Chloroflexota bacterium]